MNHRELLTALDACRPARDDLRVDDLSLPEMAAAAAQVQSDPSVRVLYFRLQNFDRATARAMHQVSVPAGLENRLLSTLHLESLHAETLRTKHVAPALNEHDPVDPLLDPVEPAAPEVQPLSDLTNRRRFIRSITALAAGVALVIGAWSLWPSARILDEGQLADSYQWHERVGDSSNWSSLTEAHWQLIPREIAGHRNGYRDATEIVGRSAVAFDLTMPGTAKATLFVIEQPERAGLPAEAPARPQSTTLGYRIGYFERDGSIYVLVVESDSLRDYQQYIDQGKFLPAA